MTTRAQADQMALAFLSAAGPHTLPNPLETEEDVCAALIFLDLEKQGLVTRTDFGNGHVQIAINDAGRRALA